jgi:predicted RNA binding protein YcfA (HicA-like mRNA interferase family)
VSRIAALTPKEIAVMLERMGYEFVRQRGSHRIYVKEQRQVIVPMHAKTLKRPTQMNIIKGTGLSPEEFMSWR